MIIELTKKCAKNTLFNKKICVIEFFVVPLRDFLS